MRRIQIFVLVDPVVLETDLPVPDESLRDRFDYQPYVLVGVFLDIVADQVLRL